ncbi:hypothetical protein P3875_10360 [Myroides sp. JBRI-B21084]|uniref:hypothetical protein n=1 Tax=Myroides sp. JBRI-B21084 TaxID=3119977 RepID=UPI0026E46283|nr:hypothetical protein [Paenimyroides cloacae]WKW46175.1 hypothetical protein P3875_10360 [Paenimyroides cloacae]
MKIMLPIAVICMLPSTVQNSFSVDLEFVRKNFEQATSNKKTCQMLIEKLEKNTTSNVHLAYLGALQAIWAKHVFSPATKLKTFNKGKQNLEKAVKNEPNNVEIRFLRLTIQQNAPFFLNYDQNIATDKAFILKNKNAISSVTLQQLINKIL